MMFNFYLFIVMSKNRLDYTANLGRHSHDVSQGYTSSIAPGCLVPQYFDILQPNDKIFYKTHMFTRFQDVPTAFLGEIDMHIDYFFVPLQMIYTLFGQVFAQTDDVISSFYDLHSHQHFDNLPILDLITLCDDESFADDTIQNKCLYNDVDCVGKGMFRLLDALDYNANVYNYYYASRVTDYDVPLMTFVGFPAALAAYQAIYQKYYRNEEIERFNIGAFNLDDAFNNENLDVSRSHGAQLLTLRYCGRPNDYFTNIRFSPIATSINAFNQNSVGNYRVDGGEISDFGWLASKVRNFLGPVNTSFDSQGVNNLIGTSPSYANNFGGVSSSSESDDFDLSYLSAQNIRAVFALDKYMRVYGRAGKTYDDQILAHFGVKIPHDVKHDLTHLKHYRMVLQSDPVLSTADTEHGSVGSVGGQVAGELNTNEESFTAPVHGVFMAIAYVVTHPRYFFTNSRLHSINNRLSFPIPEFDKLGAQPLYNIEYSSPADTNRLWMNRYQEFKQKYNRVSITFAHDYHVSQDTDANFFSPWVVSRHPYSFDGSYFNVPRFMDFFEWPSALDNIMTVPYNGDWSQDYVENPHLALQTDPILTEFACFAKKVSWMSPTGEPDL